VLIAGLPCRHYGARMIGRPFALVLSVLLVLAALPTAAGEGDWGRGLKASVRLIASGVDVDGRLAAGIEVVMPPGWHTYWRSPGDAGIAPIFDFSASRNIADVKVDFPVPTRLDDGFSVTNVYYDRVVFPVSAVVENPAEPVELAVAIDLGVCAEICVPDSVVATIAVPPGASDPAAAATLAEARALLPAPPEAGVFAVSSVVRDGGTDKRPVFRFVTLVPDSPSADILVEGPNDWSAYLPVRTAEAGNEVVWSVKFSRLGAITTPEGVAFRVTLISGGRAIEQSVSAN
jgi:DsbC/DsbD-like thiol-disulfide interchange protein